MGLGLADPRLVAADTDTMDRHEWLLTRRNGIGSSDAAAVLGWSPWVSPWALWIDKSGLGPPDDESTEAMEWGRRLEDAIAEGFTERAGIPTTAPNAIFAHHEHKWMLASPDRLLPEGGLLEVKNVSEWKIEEWRAAEDVGSELRGGEAPAHYIAQVQHQHAVLGTTWGYLAALLGGNRLCIVEVPRDEEFIALLTDAEHYFWHEYVLAGKPPPMDGQEPTTDLLVRLFTPSVPESSVELDDDAVQALADYRAAHAAVKAAEAAKVSAGNRLRAALGETEEGTYQGVKVVTWRAPKPHKRLDEQALRAAEPAVAAKYERDVVPSRRLDVSRSKAARELLAALRDGGADGDD